MEKYFEFNGLWVTDYKDNAAKYCIRRGAGTIKETRIFDNLPDATMYCIALANGCRDDRKIMTMIDAFNGVTKTFYPTN